jgi:hypothetical protein
VKAALVSFTEIPAAMSEEMPKSHRAGVRGARDLRRMLAGFTSLWTIPPECSRSSARESVSQSRRTSPSGMGPRAMSSARLPRGRCSMISKRRPVSSSQPRSRVFTAPPPRPSRIPSRRTATSGRYLGEPLASFSTLSPSGAAMM